MRFFCFSRNVGEKFRGKNTLFYFCYEICILKIRFELAYCLELFGLALLFCDKDVDVKNFADLVDYLKDELPLAHTADASYQCYCKLGV